MNEKRSKLIIVLLFIISVVFTSATYFKINFPLTNFEEIVFSLKHGMTNVDNTIFLISAVKIGLPSVVLFAILYVLFYGKRTIKTKKGKQIYPIKLITSHRKVLITVLFIISMSCLLNSLGFFEYVYYSCKNSSFIEENYVDSENVEVNFEKKNNLVFIVVESLENSYFTKEQGGYWNYDLIPELYSLLEDKDSVTFYNKNKVEGINMLEGSSWTTASLISNLSGVPLKVGLTDTTYDKKHFFNNTYALGDLLKDNGYHNELISSAKTEFEGLKEYYTIHGNYDIIDIDSLDKYNLQMTESDKGGWGFNDKYLFETAKKRLDVLSKENKPFNLNLVTIDTHFIDGFVGDYSTDKYKLQYENAFATESKLIYDFVEYVKKQDYYKDTTIVVIGDHLTMQSDLFRGKNVKDRYVYNCIINPVEKTSYNKERIATALDYYPTIVYAIGGSIKEEKLGLGTNLFSGKNTLAEYYGLDNLNKELRKKSSFYNDNIISSKGR